MNDEILTLLKSIDERLRRLEGRPQLVEQREGPIKGKCGACGAPTYNTIFCSSECLAKSLVKADDPH